jgi:hypothetical protein
VTEISLCVCDAGYVCRWDDLDALDRMEKYLVLLYVFVLALG